MSLLADLKTMVEAKKVSGTDNLLDKYQDRIQVDPFLAPKTSFLFFRSSVRPFIWPTFPIRQNPSICIGNGMSEYWRNIGAKGIGKSNLDWK
jgi:hypothetical protein